MGLVVAVRMPGASFPLATFEFRVVLPAHCSLDLTP